MEAPSGEELQGFAAFPTQALQHMGFMASIQNIAKKLKGKFPTAAIDEATGAPKLLFHGTPAAFQEFDLGKAQPGLYGKGIYLTDNPEVAHGYAVTSQAHLSDFDRQQNIRPAFVKIQKPFDIEAPISTSEALRVAEVAQKQLGSRVPSAATFPSMIKRNWEKSDKTGGALYEWLRNNLGSPEAVSMVIKDSGYDGITHIGGKVSGTAPHRVWIAFDEKQVVSPFDPELHK
jgi:hypothetical protein